MGLVAGTELMATALAARFPISTELKPGSLSQAMPILGDVRHRVAFELHCASSKTTLRSWASHERELALVAQVQRNTWPGVMLDQEPAPIPTVAAAAGFECGLLGDPAIPVAPPGDVPPTAPIDGVLRLAADLRADEFLLLQLVLSPIRDWKWRQRERALARRVRWGAGPTDIDLARAIEGKAESFQMLAAVRVAAFAATRDGARQLLRRAKAALRLGMSLNRLTPTATVRSREFLRALKERRPGVLPLSALEISGLWGAGSGRRPARVLVGGPAVLRFSAPDGVLGVRLGFGVSADGPVDVLLPDGQIPHLVIVGETGTSKTTICEHLLLQLAQRHLGACFIDPKGGAFDRLERILPSAGRDDVKRIDPGVPVPSFGLDLIRYASTAPNVDLFVEYITTMIEHLAPGSVPSYRREALIRSGCKLLTEIPGSSLPDLVKLFVDTEWRREHLVLAEDDEARSFLELQLDRTSRSEALSAAMPVVNAIAPIISNPFMRSLLTIEPQLDISQLLEEDGILLVNASEGQIGTSASSLLTATIPSIIQLTAAGRGRPAAPGRRDFFIIIDEFHRLPGEIIARILSEARGYGIRLVLVTQYLNQVPPEARSALFGNAGGWIVFRVGNEDARILAERLGDPVTPEDLLRQENYRATVRISLPGWMPPPFTLWTDPPLEAPERSPHPEGQSSPLELPEPALEVPQKALPPGPPGRRARDVDED